MQRTLSSSEEGPCGSQVFWCWLTALSTRAIIDICATILAAISGTGSVALASKSASEGSSQSILLLLEVTCTDTTLESVFRVL